jgi:hypothetical protein
VPVDVVVDGVFSAMIMEMIARKLSKPTIVDYIDLLCGRILAISHMLNYGHYVTSTANGYKSCI